LIDLETGKKRYLLDSVGGFTGLARGNGYFYALAQTSPTKIYIIEKNTEKIILDQELREVSDPHSIAVDKEIVYIVSTSDDSVLKYKFNKKKMRLVFEGVFWTPKDSSGRKDTCHYNGLANLDNHIRWI